MKFWERQLFENVFKIEQIADNCDSKLTLPKQVEQKKSNSACQYK